MKNSYIAVHKKRGIYLGVVSGYALFSESSMAISSKAIRFEDPGDIQSFFSSVLPALSEDIEPVKIQTNETGNYVGVADILKSGYYNYTDSMVDALPSQSESIH